MLHSPASIYQGVHIIHSYMLELPMLVCCCPKYCRSHILPIIMPNVHFVMLVYNVSDLSCWCSLLYMCGLCYQWLKSDLSVSQTTGQLRTGELMLLRVRRVYIHHLKCVLRMCVCIADSLPYLTETVLSSDDGHFAGVIGTRAHMSCHWNACIIGCLHTRRYSSVEI